MIKGSRKYRLHLEGKPLSHMAYGSSQMIGKESIYHGNVVVFDGNGCLELDRKKELADENG